MEPPPPDPLDRPPADAGARADRLGLVGYGCLVVTSLGAGLGGGLLLLVGIGRVATGGQATLRHAEDAHELSRSLELAVAQAGGGALLLLVALVALIVLLREMGDDAARRARGPVR